MRSFVRQVREQRELWKIWLVLVPLVIGLAVLSTVTPLIEKQLIDAVVLAGRPDLLTQTLVLYGAVWVLNTAIATGSGGVLTYQAERVSMGLRRRLLAHSAALSLFFSQAHSGRTMSLFSSDVPAVTSLVGSTVTQALGCVVTLVTAAALMFALSPQLAVAGALAPPLVAVITAIFVTRPLRPAARRLQDKLAELTEGIHENLAGTREVVAFGRERSQELLFSTTLRELMRLRMRLTVLESGMRAGQSMFSLAITVVILGYGGYLVIHGDTTLGTVIAMRSLFGLVVGPAGRLFGLVGDAQKAVAAADRIYAFLDETPRVQQTPAARTPTNVRGQVSFRGVSFAYRPGYPVLQDLTFTVLPGERLALVGPSGAGKSTLASLVARFYDPTGGQVLLDGVDLRDLTLPGLRATIGIVFQNTFLFATTVRENIAFGREGASADEVIAAARAANAWEFIAELPEGLDTEVGERGVLLSEGQRQRIAIARALLRDPRILILDEPTSALDARSEHLVRTALANLVRERTTFVIAHRLGTVIGADRILVLDAGRIVQEGVHTELVRQDGMYRDLFRLQFPDVGVRVIPDGRPAPSPIA